MDSHDATQQLLAIDVGLRCGLALFDRGGRLRWYRACSFADVQQLKRATSTLISAAQPLTWLFTAGDISYAAPFERTAMRLQVRVQRVTRSAVRTGLIAPSSAALRVSVPDQAAMYEALVRRAIRWSHAPVPAVLPREAHDAILIGLWATQSLGWTGSLQEQRTSQEAHQSAARTRGTA